MNVYTRFQPNYHGVLIIHNQYLYPVILWNTWNSKFNGKATEKFNKQYTTTDNIKYILALDNKSCQETCESKGLICNRKDVAFINNCQKLRNYFNCKFCAQHVQKYFYHR